MPERLAQTAHDPSPPRVVVHQLPDGVQHVRALVVLVAGAFVVHSVDSDDRLVVPYQLALTNRILRPCLLSLLTLGEKTFGVGSETLVDPHIGGILHSDAVAEPFVRALVDDDEIPEQSVPRRRAVAAEVSILVVIAVSDRALVLHSQVRRLDELVTILVPRERTEPVLEALQHRLHLLELFLRCIGVIVDRPEVEAEVAALSLIYVAEMRVMTRVHRDVVVVDRVFHKPLVGCGSIPVRRGAPQSPIRHIDQRVRNGDGDSLTVGLVGVDVLVGPPYTRAQTFVGGGDPWTRKAVARPDVPSIPRRSDRRDRLAVVIDGDLLPGADRLWRDQSDEKRVAVAAGAELGAVLDYAVNYERHLQVDLHLARWFQDAVSDGVVPDDGAVAGIRFDV